MKLFILVKRDKDQDCPERRRVGLKLCVVATHGRSGAGSGRTA